MRSDGKALQTDTEDLTFETILHHGLFLLEDLIERLLEEMTVHHVVHTLVLTAVVYPKIHDTGVILCLAHGIGNVTATLGVLDPEIADSLIGIGQRKVAALGVREAGAVEIQLGVVGLGPVDPTLEVFYGHFVTVNNLALEIAIDFMQVQTVVSGNEAHGFEDIRTQFVDITGCTGEIARTLDAATEGTGLHFESFYIIGLPTMKGEVEVLHLFQYFLGINSDFRVALLGYGISLGKKTIHKLKIEN